MKLYISAILFGIASLTSSSFAQIRSNNAISSTVGGQSVFLDASANGFTTTPNIGKGISFPRTNLTTFTFVTPTTGALNFPTAYDGMIVYNSGTGNTPATGSGIGGQAITPGFYYFSNPTAGPGNFTTAGGQWLPMGGNPRFNVTTAETTTNTLVNNNQVYAKKGRFVTSGTSTAPTSYPDGAITIPASGTAGIYRVTVFKAGTGSVFANGVYSYDIATGNLITGSPSMSVVYPADTYDYIVEYTK